MVLDEIRAEILKILDDKKKVEYKSILGRVKDEHKLKLALRRLEEENIIKKTIIDKEVSYVRCKQQVKHDLWYYTRVLFAAAIILFILLHYVA